MTKNFSENAIHQKIRKKPFNKNSTLILYGVILIFALLMLFAASSYLKIKGDFSNCQRQKLLAESEIEDLENRVEKLKTEKDKLEQSFNNKLNCQKTSDTFSSVIQITQFSVVDLPDGALSYQEDNIMRVKMNGAVYRIDGIDQVTTFGLCPWEDDGSNCTYDDHTDIKNIGKLRVWKDNQGIFALNPQEIMIEDEYLNNFRIFKESPDQVISQEELASWKSILSTLRITE